MPNNQVLPAFKAHGCTRCNASYILFKKGALCPNCRNQDHVQTHEHYMFIPALLRVMQSHKRKYNRYSPDVWFVDSVCDEISKICFHIFDRLEAEDGNDHGDRIKKILDEVNWRKRGHLKIHSREIIAELHKQYLANKPRHSVFSRVRSVLVS